MKLSLRSAFSLILAALAFACAGAIERGEGGENAGRAEAPALHHPRRAPAQDAEQAHVPAYFRGGTLVLDGPIRRVGTPPPRAANGSTPSHFRSFAAWTARRRAAGARIRGILALTLARRLAAARDGTLSSRSNGVPPPVPA